MLKKLLFVALCLTTFFAANTVAHAGENTFTYYLANQNKTEALTVDVEFCEMNYYREPYRRCTPQKPEIQAGGFLPVRVSLENSPYSTYTIEVKQAYTKSRHSSYPTMVCGIRSYHGAPTENSFFFNDSIPGKVGCVIGVVK